MKPDAEPQPSDSRTYPGGWFGIALIVLASVVLYASTFDHAFHLDSTYGLVDNPSIRSLSNIPQFFWDPFTLTSLRSNADYRPLLQVTYAINHAISGYSMWSWHAVQILLHAFNAVCLMRIVEVLIPKMLPAPTHQQRNLIPLLVALLFVVHPTASGVVNYLWARSSLLTAAFLLPAILSFMRQHYRRASWLYALALLTKIEAVGCLGLFGAWLILKEAEQRMESGRSGGMWTDLRSALCRRNFTIMAPMLLTTAAMAGVRMALLPDFLAEARSDPWVTHLDYLMTQTTAWWHYVFNWWFPWSLVADDLAYPVYDTFEHPVVFASVYGWCLVGVVLHGIYKHRPCYPILAVSALALIAPHSSFLPLTEMVNEHRPYLSMGLLSVCWLVPGLGWLVGGETASSTRRTASAAVVIAAIVMLGQATTQRNQVFQSWYTYWSDTLTKAPSWRAHNNMGWHHLNNGDWKQAEEHFEAAMAFKNVNPIVLTNRAVVADKQGRRLEAKQWHDRAVVANEYTSIALEHRAAHLLNHGQYETALNDLNRAKPTTMRPHWVHIHAAQALAGLGNWQEASREFLEARTLDGPKTEASIQQVAAPYWASDSQAKSGILFFKALEAQWPRRWWIHANMARLAAKTGDAELAQIHSGLADSIRASP